MASEIAEIPNDVFSYNFEEICRICLKRDEQLISLYDIRSCAQGKSISLAEKIQLVAGVQISENDGLPLTICSCCTEIVEKFYDFRLLVQASDVELHLQLESAECEEVKVEDEIQDKSEYDCEDPDSLDNADKEFSSAGNLETETNFEEIDAILVPSEEGYQVWKVCKNSDFEDKFNLVQFLEDNKSAIKVVKTRDVNLQDSKEQEKLDDWDSKKTKVKRFRSCEICYQTFSNNLEFSIHECIEPDDNLVQKFLTCQLCTQGFETEKELKNHVIEHVINRRSDVNSILEPSQVDELLNEKNMEDQSSSEKKCRFCKKVFFQTASLLKHELNHVVESEFICEECGKSFTKQSELRYHKGTHIDELPQCSICNKSFQNIQSFKIHMKRHTLGTRFVCEICGKSYYTNSELSRHKQKHAKTRAFPCALCDMSFLSKPELNRHVKYHKGDKKFTCDICFKSYFESGHLKVHRRVHTGERPFLCKVCNKSFITNSKLLRHEKIHEKPNGTV